MFNIIPYSIRKFSNIHIQGKENILLFSTPRSGSTWLLEMIAGQPRIKTVREPLNIRLDHIREMLGFNSWEEIYKEENFPQVVSYLKRFSKNLSIDYRFKREKPFTDTWHPITTRLVYKILHGLEDRVGELTDRLDASSIVLIRHPIPVSLSREVLPRLEAYQSTDYKKHFTDKELSFAKFITNEGSNFEKGILSWCFQNKVLIEQSKAAILVSYEELVMNRDCVLSKISDHLKLPDPQKMLIRSRKASGSTSKSTKRSVKLLKEVRMGEKSYLKLIEKWKAKTSSEMIEKAQNILDEFEISAYRAGAIMPAKDFLICPNSYSDNEQIQDKRN